MINYKEIDLVRLNDQFSKDRRVVIDNFLDKEFIEKLYKYYFNDMPKSLWSATYMPSYKFPHTWEWWQNIPINRYNMEQAYQYVCSARDSSMFSYFFYKTMPEVMKTGDVGVYDETVKFFNSEIMIDFINKVTNLNVTTGEKTFVSRYAENCFLSKHTDEVNGKLAFVLHLSKNWNPDWGGLYLDLRDESNIKVVNPSFNRLVLFEVTNASSPHAVTQIVNNSLNERISISGWFN
jgi:SM-20-related protein